jgi:hypothetical protein
MIKILSCLTALLFVLNIMAAPGRAFFRVPSGTPVIDGKDSDKIWKNATVLRNFLNCKGTAFSKEASTVKICHDANNLYFYFKLQSFALDSTSNQMDSFKAAIKTRDGNVWADDSVEIRLEKRSGGFPVYIAFNSNGAVLDMKYVKGDWEKEFNIPLKIKAGKKQGFWFAEIAIPLKSISTDSDFTKSEWQINFVRFNQRLKETSSWVYLKDGNHMNMSNHGIMRLYGKTSIPVVTASGIQNIENGKIPFEAIGNYSRGVPWLARVYNGNNLIAKKTGKSKSKCFDIILPAVKNSGYYTLQFYVSDSSGRTIYSSPLYPCSSQKREILFAIEEIKQMDLFNNGQKITSDRTDLSSGANNIEIVAPASLKISGTVSCMGKEYPIDNTWHIQKKDRKIHLSKTIILRGTRFLPVPAGGEWVLSHNGVYTLVWDGSGFNGLLPKQPVKDMSIILDVPHELKFLGASYSQYPLTGLKKPDGQAPLNHQLYSWEKLKETAKYTKYKVKVNYPVSFANRKEVWLERVQRHDKACYLAFKAIGKPGVIPPLKYYMRANNIIEIPENMSCRIIPELNAKSPKKISFLLKADSLDLVDENIVKKYFDCLKSSGLNEIFAVCHVPYPKKINIDLLGHFNLVSSKLYTFPSSAAAMDELFERFPEAQGHWGKRKRFGVDPSYVTRTPETWPYIEKAMVESFKRVPGQANLFWDYEYSPFPGHIQMYPCFSNKGIKAFAQRYGINTQLTPSIIQKNYKQQWINFSCGEVANMIKLVSNITHKYNRKLYLYSGYQNCTNGKEYYNIDWEKVGQHVDRAYCGYGRNLKLIADTKACLSGKPLAGGLLKQGDTAQANTPAEILRKVIDCGGGVILWYECRFDGKALNQIAEAANLVADFEEILLNGQRCDNIIDASTLTKDNIAAYTLNKKLVLFLLNERSATQKIEFKIKSNVGVLTQYGKNKTYPTNKVINIEIPAGKIIVLTGKTL